ncbi:mitochondrial 37S ribosomal protein uS10m [Aspergillus undulatus]|uniref:mitochondrial 37S ribosomal protein uS10m n=1 Tax=Aspergillus undulatus TaxID=1810928 RepID=UPI003CCD367A
MSLPSPHRVLFRAFRPFQFATASRVLSTSSQPVDIKDPQSAVSQAESAEKISLHSQQPVDSPVKEWGERLNDINANARLPRSVQALYLRPLRKKAEYGLPVCDLQLRSYSVRNLEFFADFAIRAAYYLKLPVSGPVPLPKITERWTFPRSNFVHKKSQENFERITLRRLIQVKDGNPQVVQAWLAFVRKHAFYGVGMKANIWEHENIDIAKNMDQALPEIERNLEPHLSQFGRRDDATSNAQAVVADFLGNERLSLNKGPLTKVGRR